MPETAPPGRLLARGWARLTQPAATRARQKTLLDDWHTNLLVCQYGKVRRGSTPDGASRKKHLRRQVIVGNSAASMGYSALYGVGGNQ